MNLPIGRFLGKGGLEHWKKFGRSAKKNLARIKLTALPRVGYQLTHNALFPHDCVHVENLGGEIGNKALLNKRITLGRVPVDVSRR